jgi:GntR family transcriptional regulator/MocR family aminotransferase
MIFLDINNGEPLYEQLFSALRQGIIQKELKKDSALKPIRVLAKELNISNNTVNRAYQQLLAEGYIRSVQGSGYYVEDIQTLLGVKGPANDNAVVNGGKIDDWLKYDFSYENIEADYFPWTKWRKYIQDAVLEESYNTKLNYEVNKGNVILRESLCDYINNSRGVNCGLHQIIVCAGTQYAMDIITNILPKKKYVIGVEEPGYGGMRKIFANKGYTIKPLSISDSGIDLAALEKSDCNLLYLTPSHQFPTGVKTSLEKRMQILAWAQKKQAYIIENDYDNEFLYGEKPLPSMQSLDKEDNVIYLSTLSKVLSPALRCAYFVLPDALLKAYEDQYQYYYAALPTYHQKALAYFIRDGHLERHVRKMALLNRKKYEIFNRVMEKELSEEVEIFPVPAGSHVLMQIKGCDNQESFIKQMQRKGLKIYGTKSYWADRTNAPEDLFLFGYNALSEQELEAACIALTHAVRETIGACSEK